MEFVEWIPQLAGDLVDEIIDLPRGMQEFIGLLFFASSVCAFFLLGNHFLDTPLGERFSKSRFGKVFTLFFGVIGMLIFVPASLLGVLFLLYSMWVYPILLALGIE